MFVLQSPIRYKEWGADSGYVTLTQGFGKNQLEYAKLGLLAHNGQDYRTVQYEEGHALVMAAHDGTVIDDGSKGSLTAGVGVKILSDVTEIDGKECKVMTLYYHLKVGKCKVGDKVRAGQVIAIGNNSGQFTTGAHLHFGMYPLWKDKNGNYTKVASNGYDGAVDPMPYLQDGNVYYERTGWIGGDWFYMGKKITRKTANPLIKKV